jgi:hypothetical protein
MIRRHAFEAGVAVVRAPDRVAHREHHRQIDDGVEHDPAWADGAAFFIALVAAHVVTGYAVGRWWALGLPVAWAALSAGAEGYDTPVAVLIAFGLPLFWLPAVASGVGARRLLVRRAARSS